MLGANDGDWLDHLSTAVLADHVHDLRALTACKASDLPCEPDTRVSRKVVRKVIRSEATEFRYERGTQPMPKIRSWREQIDAVLLANELRPPRERLTLIRVFEDLRRLGYAGSYDAVRRWRTPMCR